MTPNISFRCVCKSYSYTSELGSPRTAGEFVGVSRYLVVKHFVLRPHARQEGVLGQVILPAAILLISSVHLFIQGLDVGWEEADELEGLPLILGKRGAFVVVRIMEKC